MSKSRALVSYAVVGHNSCKDFATLSGKCITLHIIACKNLCLTGNLLLVWVFIADPAG